jgi:hypothetical protein
VAGIAVPAKAILTRTGLQGANGFAFQHVLKMAALLTQGEHQRIQQIRGIKRTHGKQAYQCADTFGAVLAKRAVFSDNDVVLQRGRYFLFQVIHLSLNRSSHSMISSVSFLFAPYLPATSLLDCCRHVVALSYMAARG